MFLAGFLIHISVFHKADKANNFALARRLHAAATSGNFNAAFALNPGDEGQPTLEGFSNFLAGEYRDLPPLPPLGMIPGYRHSERSPNLVQSHGWTYLVDNNEGGWYGAWGHPELRLKYSNDTVATCTKNIADRGGAVTWDASINPSGEWRVDHLVQLQTVGNRTDTSKDTTYSSLKLVNNDHKDIQYSGEWTHLRNRRRGDFREQSGEYRQDVHLTEINGSYFTYPFNGSSIVFATSKSPNESAEVEVYIDDISQGTFLTHAPHLQVQVIIFEKHDLSPGNAYTKGCETERHGYAGRCGVVQKVVLNRYLRQGYTMVLTFQIEK